jgi:hypothetical protein
MANKRQTKRTWNRRKSRGGGVWDYFFGAPQSPKEEPSNITNPLIPKSQSVQPPQQPVLSAQGGKRKTKRRNNKK